ncbi:putative glycolipid-binding domain-containing protein [Agrococcus sediminis]|uniref:putative glycolipid-binding domain-containing protein n=1 Tax=Agrococcus sediminis TaxID=2599924 RepID=UPI003417341A
MIASGRRAPHLGRSPRGRPLRRHRSGVIVTALPRGILRIPCRSSAAAHGTSTCDEYSAAWSLEVGEGWITRRLDVAVRAQGWARDLSLRRDDAGRWSAEARAAGRVALPAPGLSADADLDAASGPSCW